MKFVGALTLTLLFAAPLAHAETRRLAIVVGNNAGGGDMPPLRYAESDAGKMARVLVELGDVNQDDVLLLQGRRVADVERAITDARERVAMLKATPDVRTALYFYFSGHSDGESIELGPERLAYARLKALLAGTGADVRLVMVDACRSGAGLREKGGKPAPGFTIRLADTLSATGDVFITSSAADESSLESSEVMGSYFTHNFISGLRGAAACCPALQSRGAALPLVVQLLNATRRDAAAQSVQRPEQREHPNGPAPALASSRCKHRCARGHHVIRVSRAAQRTTVRRSAHSDCRGRKPEYWWQK